MRSGAGHVIRRWRFIVDYGRRGCSNMARDEALAVSAGNGAPPALRVYRFEPPAISIGRFQELDRGINLDTCRAEGIELVRRPTGGLAILHADDFTYSVTLPRGGSGLSAKERCFSVVAKGILESLRVLGVSARLSRHGDLRESASVWCLESAFGVDLELGGRKICGSALRMFPGAILQHGTLFLSENRRFLDSITVGAGSGLTTGPSFVTLAEACGREVPWEAVQSAFGTGFADALGVRLEAGSLSEEEEALAQRLTEEKYASEEWTGGGGEDSGRPAL